MTLVVFVLLSGSLAARPVSHESASTSPTRRLDVLPAGNGIITDGHAIRCGAGYNDCAARYPVNSRVRLRVMPAAGVTLRRWSVWECRAAARCTVTMRANRLVTAALDPVRLTLTRLGTGAVVSDPPGLDCEADCEQRSTSFRRDTTVTLTAIGPDFERWEGGCQPRRERTCTVRAIRDVELVAHFDNAAGPTPPDPAMPPAIPATTPTQCPTSTPSPTPTPSPSPTATASPSPTATATPSPTATATPSPTPTATPDCPPPPPPPPPSPPPPPPPPPAPDATPPPAHPSTLTASVSVTKSGAGQGVILVSGPHPSDRGIRCPARCRRVGYRLSALVRLQARPLGASAFENWANGCAPKRRRRCIVDVLTHTSMRGTFRRLPPGIRP